jgi:hypothetical protein
MSVEFDQKIELPFERTTDWRAPTADCSDARQQHERDHEPPQRGGSHQVTA